jgi:hypothetical protein
MMRLLATAVTALALLAGPAAGSQPRLRIATFEAEITPPIGAPLCDGLMAPARHIDDPLWARGLILFPEDRPIVLCALDWVGVGNAGNLAFRDALAKAAGTTRDRVCVHCLHQHDAPGLDFQAYEVLVPHGIADTLYDINFSRKAVKRVADAAARALKEPHPVTHISFGKGKVEKVASTRRVMGPDGKVKYVRHPATREPWIRAEPEGLIDPYVRCLAFWDQDRCLAVLTYYATHPQTHYGHGHVSADFPGLARSLRDREQPGVFHVHFDGAGGNVTAGKYNDGSLNIREVFAERLAKGMKEAFDTAKKVPVKAANVSWRTTQVALPLHPQYKEKDLEAQVADTKLSLRNRRRAARNLVWARRVAAGDKVDLACLKVGPVYVLHMPGELFVEYQLAAQQMRPDLPVMLAAYGDYGMGYIPTARAYTQGGYEIGPVSRVGPGSEAILMGAMRELLK